MNKHLFSLLIICCLSVLAFGQGTIRGLVIDDKTGETLFGANVVISGTTNGAMSDIDGGYSISVAPGTYTLECTYISYEKKVIENVLVVDGEVTMMDVRLGEAELEIEGVTVTAKSIRNTESALLTIQKKSANVMDGISSQTFARTGDGDAAEAIKRVTGVSVEGGSYVYVRGLGDRYTKTTLNVMEIPGLDPDRNTVQMDLFPTSIINNLVVYKTFTPNLPGDFTGGIVNVETKDFPDKKTISASASYSYNPQVHFNEDFILYDKKSGDHFGLGYKQRELPMEPTTYVPDPVEGKTELNDITNSFDEQMAVQKQNNFLDQSYSLSFGNQINRTKGSWGYAAALNYKNAYNYYDDVEYGEYEKSANSSEYELDPLRKSRGSLGKHNVLWSGLFSGAYKIAKHKINLTLLHIQDGTSKAAKLTSNDYFNSSRLVKDNLAYTQRSISSATIGGKHQAGKVQIEWKNAITYSSIADPDLRNTAFSTSSGDTTLNSGDGAQVNRIWRDLNEINNSTRVDVVFPFKIWNGLESKLTGGISNTYKSRNYEIMNYRFKVRNVATFNGDPNSLFQDENLWTAETGTGTYAIGNLEPANTYESFSNVMAVYIMNELPLHDKFKAIYGVRMEKANTYYTGQNNSGTVVFDKEKVLDEIDFLPALNLVYTIVENMNLRASYGKTLARPSFRENSIAQIYDPIQDRTYIGGLSNNGGLEETHVDNIDLRWEYFFNRGELISISGFYKKFKNPIEIVAYETNPDNVQPRNVGDGQVFGAEFELRKNLSFITDKLKDLSIGTNVTYVYSQIEMSDEEYVGSTGTGGRLGNARDGEEVKNTRVMLGQSPFIINAYLNYSSYDLGLDVNLNYNVQGKSLTIVGSGRIPDVFQTPFHNLNFKISQKVGKEKRFKLSFNVENLIGDQKEWVYQSYKAQDQIYEKYTPGRRYTLGFSYTLQ